MLDIVLNFFFPPKCPFCMEILTDKAPVCRDCLKTLAFIPETSCAVCSRPIGDYSYNTCLDCREQKIYFEHSFVPLIYKDEAKEAVLKLKGGHPSFAKGFAFLMADKILSSPHYNSFDLVTFVPQNPRRKFSRGYNQAELIAKQLSKLLKVPCLPMLKRTNDGEDQHRLTAAQRRENVKKCFFPKNETGSGTVLLVDDVYTTGATANYCAKLLRRMGFEKVYLAAGLIRAED